MLSSWSEMLTQVLCCVAPYRSGVRDVQDVQVTKNHPEEGKQDLLHRLRSLWLSEIRHHHSIWFPGADRKALENACSSLIDQRVLPAAWAEERMKWASGRRWVACEASDSAALPRSCRYVHPVSRKVPRGMTKVRLPARNSCISSACRALCGASILQARMTLSSANRKITSTNTSQVSKGGRTEQREVTSRMSWR